MRHQPEMLRYELFLSDALHRICVESVVKIALLKFTKDLKNLVLAVAYSLQRKGVSKYQMLKPVQEFGHKLRLI